jgi:superfamily II DNA or RNA helicase
LPGQVPHDVIAALLDRISAADPTLPLALPSELEGTPVEADARVFLRLTPIGSGGAALEVRFHPVPGGPAVEPGVPPARLLATVEGSRRVAARDLPAETSRAREACRALALAPDESLGWTALLDRDDDVLDLLARLGGELPIPVVVEWPEGEAARRVVSAPSTGFKIGLEGRQDWFGLTGGLEVDGELIALGVLLAAAREGRRYVAVGKGRFVELAKVFGGKLDELALLTRGGHGRAKPELPRTAALVAVSLLEGVELEKAPTSWHELTRRVREHATFEPVPSADLKAKLRPYQLDGYRWLARLAALGVGGCLADDMGTGKTVEAIAALLDRRAEGPVLVVAPTSVGFNWARELERFAPSLRARSYRTEDRTALLESAGPGDVVVTSYGLLRQDAEALAGVEWGTVVLDEAQAIKNAATETARAARALRGKWTVLLTGTPVENHLGELWSLFHTVAPGLLGSWEQFAARFAGPIERDRSASRRAALARILRPFILRRTKGDVLKELPARTEVRLDVVLSKAERALYEKARLEAIARLANPIRGRDQRFEVLAELTRLRQLACHARLVEPKAPLVSAKLAVLLEQLAEILEGGHCALVFSQFTRHLDLVGEALEREGIHALRLDGKTPARERERLVNAFQAGEAPVFLISLKAGGTGLNLTAADYVFHLDPWWNPAVEDQAADRAHRIGQQRAVTVVRLVSRDTIEEKVLALHDDKRELVAGILDGTERAAKLSTKDLLALLQEGAREAGGVDVADEPVPAARPLRREAVALGDLVEGFRAYVVAQGAGKGSASTYVREVRSLLGDVLLGDASTFEPSLLERLESIPRDVARYLPTTRKGKATALSRFVAFLEGKGALGDGSLARAKGIVAQLRR